MNNVANAGTICVPIAVPCCCIKCSLLKSKLFMVKIVRMRSHIYGFCRNRSVSPLAKSYSACVDSFVSWNVCV